MFLEGKNPYSLGVFNESRVPVLCLYTMIYPLLVAGVCKLTGISIIAGYYLVNLLLVGLIAFNLWCVVSHLFNRLNGLAFLCVAINSMTFCSLFGLPIFNFHTDTIGIYVVSLMLLVVYKNKQLILPLSILSVFLILTKQILIVMVVPLFIFYMIVDKKLAMKYVLECLLIGMLVYWGIQVAFPLYWTETIYAQFFTSRAYGSIHDSVSNIMSFFTRYYLYIILSVCGGVAFIYNIGKHKKIKPIVIVKELVEQEEYIVYLVLNILFGTLFLLYFAKCGGDGYKYCQDLLAPSFFLLGVFAWNGVFKERLLSNERRFHLKLSFSLLVLCVATAVTYENFNWRVYTREDVRECEELQDIISEHIKEMMYLGMNSTQFLLSNDLWNPENIDFNDGHIEYFVNENGNKQIWDTVFYSKEIHTAATSYVSRVNQYVDEKAYGLITICIDSIIDKNLLMENYYLFNTYGIKTDTNGIMEVQVWLPQE